MSPEKASTGGRSERHQRRTTQPSIDPSRSSPKPGRHITPIFVWVRQEDNRIVDVKCEDYDRRNRIILTKTKNGWRAIPRTETNDATNKDSGRRHKHKHRKRKKHDTKTFQVEPKVKSPTWTLPVNIESHLLSHRIHKTDEAEGDGVQTEQQTINPDVKSDCEVKPGENHEDDVHGHLVKSDETFGKSDNIEGCDENPTKMRILTKTYGDGVQVARRKEPEIESMPPEDEPENENPTNEHFEEDVHLKNEGNKNELDEDDAEVIYIDDDDNGSSIDDDVSLHLFQGLGSPEQQTNGCYTNLSEDVLHVPLADGDVIRRTNGTNGGIIIEHRVEADSFEEYIYNNRLSKEPEISADGIQSLEIIALNNGEQFEDDSKSDYHEEETHDVEFYKEHANLGDVQSTPYEDVIQARPFESAIHHAPCDTTRTTQQSLEEVPQVSTTFRSEAKPFQMTSQVEPTAAHHLDPKSVEDDVHNTPLENLLAVAEFEFNQQIMINPKPDECDYNEDEDNNIAMGDILTRLERSLQSPPPVSSTEEPTDLSMKVTTWDKPTDLSSKKTFIPTPEVVDLSIPPRPPSSQSPQPSGIPAVPPSPDTSTKPVRRKSSSPTVSCSQEVQRCKKVKSNRYETPKLLELLQSNSLLDPLLQFRQLYYDPNANMPDPMLVPKNRLSSIISAPLREIPLLLEERPELRLPNALTLPHLLKDPDILVITLQQLETIIAKQNECEKSLQKPIKKVAEPQLPNYDPTLNPMFWLPYLNHLETVNTLKMMANEHLGFPPMPYPVPSLLPEVPWQPTPPNLYSPYHQMNVAAATAPTPPKVHQVRQTAKKTPQVRERRPREVRTQQPMDLSGVHPSKLKVKHHTMDNGQRARLMRHEDVPEVVSTTTEEPNDGPKHLWHPLFGSQTSYQSPWNWTAAGE